MKTPKTYKSKLGKEFRIVNMTKPREGEVVFFTHEEWAWIKDQNLSSEEFDWLWKAKYEDHRHEIITKTVIAEKQKFAVEMCEKIKAMLRGNKSDSTMETQNNGTEELRPAPGKLPEGGEGDNPAKPGDHRTGWEKRAGEDDDTPRVE